MGTLIYCVFNEPPLFLGLKTDDFFATAYPPLHIFADKDEKEHSKAHFEAFSFAFIL